MMNKDTFFVFKGEYDLHLWICVYVMQFIRIYENHENIKP